MFQECKLWETHLTMRITTLSRINEVLLLQQTIYSRAVPAASVAVGIQPRGIAFDGSHIWVVNWGSHNVSKIDINNNAVVTSVASGGGPQGIAFDGTHIWVANEKNDGLSKIDMIRNVKLTDFSMRSSPWGIAFEGTHIWVTNNGSDSAIKIRKII